MAQGASTINVTQKVSFGAEAAVRGQHRQRDGREPDREPAQADGPLGIGATGVEARHHTERQHTRVRELVERGGDDQRRADCQRHERHPTTEEERAPEGKGRYRVDDPSSAKPPSVQIWSCSATATAAASTTFPWRASACHTRTPRRYTRFDTATIRRPSDIAPPRHSLVVRPKIAPGGDADYARAL